MPLMIDLAAQEADQFELAVLLDREPDRIDVGEPLPGRVLLPVVRVSRQQDI
jgi:hypothetical protein